MTDATDAIAGPRFFGLQVQRFLELLVQQSQDLFASLDIDTPVRATSTFVLLAENPGASLADLARWLEQPHQLVAQRLQLLMRGGFVRRRGDPKDRRRKAFFLTEKGRTHVARVKMASDIGVRAIEDLGRELGVDLFAAIDNAHRGLLRSPVADRVAEDLADLK